VWSTAFAFLVVLIYMLVYYFRSGFIADVALLLNLVLLVGAMAFLDAVLTLPGIAGVVLTLGMAVDANILVYERIREEQQRGRSVHKAVSEGFDRAFTTIVDSHVTTFLTAIFLYIFGAGSIKGFAVTLGIGLIASMFTAVYVTRTIFEAWLRRGKVKHIAMLGTGKAPSIHWMKMRRYFIPASVFLTAAALIVFAVLPRSTVYDIDFTGGMKLQVRFARPTTVEEVKRSLDSGPRTVKIPKDPSRGETGLLETITGPYPAAEVVQVGTEGTAVEVRNALRPPNEDPAALREREQVDALKAYAEQALQDRLVPTWVREAPAPYVKKGDADPYAKYDGRLHLKIALYDPRGALSADRIRNALVQRLPYAHYSVEGRTREQRDPDTIVRDLTIVEVPDASTAGGEGKAHVKTYEIWWKADEKGTNPAAVETEPARLEADLREFLSSAKFKDSLTKADAPTGSAEAVGLADPFPGTDLIGEGAAKKLRNDALLALLASLGAIVIYVAFRFRSYAMGFSAVIILMHDVFVALLAVCIVDYFGILDARINLGLVAAFLTIVGYSVNEVVVTFDRIRELRGSAPKITTKMIEDGINQTFSRTMRTTMTVILTVIVLFVMNLGQRSMLEGLSFTLLVGITSGRYSAVGVAGPLLLFLPWFWAKARPYAPSTRVLTWPTKKNGMWILLGLVVAGFALGYVTTGRPFLAVFYGFVVFPLAATLGLWLAWLAVFTAVCFVWSSVLLIPWSFHEDPEAAADAAHRELGLSGPGGATLPAGGSAASPTVRETSRSADYKAKGADKAKGG
jgi:SecD/SecF fusion protein